MITKMPLGIEFVLRCFVKPALQLDETLLPLRKDERRTKAEKARLQILPMNAVVAQRLARAAQKRRTQFIEMLQFVV